MAALTDITKLNKHMETASYIEGATPTQADISVFKAVAEPGTGFPHAQRWYKHIASFSATKVASLPGTFETLSAGAAAPAPPPAKQEKQEKAPKEKKEKPAKEEKKKEEKKEVKAAAPDDAAKAAAAEKKLKEKIIKEGGKKGVEIEGASDMGGLDFFCTTMELPEGNLEYLEMSMDAMNADPDPDAEDRKGCSGHVGKMIFSAGVEQLAIVAYVPDASHNKSADKVDCQTWLDTVLKEVKGDCTKKAAAAKSPKGGKIAVGVVKKGEGKFPIKDKDTAMATAFNFLRSKGAFPEDTGDDDSDEMIFGDDDDLANY